MSPPRELPSSPASVQRQGGPCSCRPSRTQAVPCAGPPLSSQTSPRVCPEAGRPPKEANRNRKDERPNPAGTVWRFILEFPENHTPSRHRSPDSPDLAPSQQPHRGCQTAQRIARLALNQRLDSPPQTVGLDGSPPSHHPSIHIRRAIAILLILVVFHEHHDVEVAQRRAGKKSAAAGPTGMASTAVSVWPQRRPARTPLPRRPDTEDDPQQTTMEPAPESTCGRRRLRPTGVTGTAPASTSIQSLIVRNSESAMATAASAAWSACVACTNRIATIVSMRTTTTMPMAMAENRNISSMTGSSALPVWSAGQTRARRRAVAHRPRFLGVVSIETMASGAIDVSRPAEPGLKNRCRSLPRTAGSLACSRTLMRMRRTRSRSASNRVAPLPHHGPSGSAPRRSSRPARRRLQGPASARIDTRRRHRERQLASSRRRPRPHRRLRRPVIPAPPSPPRRLLPAHRWRRRRTDGGQTRSDRRRTRRHRSRARVSRRGEVRPLPGPRARTVSDAPLTAVTVNVSYEPSGSISIAVDPAANPHVGTAHPVTAASSIVVDPGGRGKDNVACVVSAITRIAVNTSPRNSSNAWAPRRPIRRGNTGGR